MNTPASTGTGSGLSLNPGAARVVSTISVPVGYFSGMPLSSTATWDDTTLDALGAAPGIYTWTWGSGAHADSLTLEIAIPEPAPALLLTLGAATLLLLTRLSSALSRKP